MKTILTMVLATMIISVATAGQAETNVHKAKKKLNEKISVVLNEDMNQSGNYFYQHRITRIKEDLKVSFYVNNDQELVLLRVRTDNQDAKAYIKHFFRYNTIKADQILTGRAYTFNLHLRYKAF